MLHRSTLAAAEWELRHADSGGQPIGSVIPVRRWRACMIASALIQVVAALAVAVLAFGGSAPVALGLAAAVGITWLVWLSARPSPVLDGLRAAPEAGPVSLEPPGRTASRTLRQLAFGVPIDVALIGLGVLLGLDAAIPGGVVAGVALSGVGFQLRLAPAIRRVRYVERAPGTGRDRYYR